MNPSPLTLSMSIGADELFGVRHDGVWSFCSTMPGLAEKWSGDTITTHAVEEFTRYAVANATLSTALGRLADNIDRAKGGA